MQYVHVFGKLKANQKVETITAIKKKKLYPPLVLLQVSKKFLLSYVLLLFWYYSEKLYIWKFTASNSDMANMLENWDVKLEEGKIYYNITEKTFRRQMLQC